MTINFKTSCISLVLLTCQLVRADDWLQFRGNHHQGLALDSSPPTNINAEKNIAWKTALPGRGLSSPIIIGNRVFLTAASTVDQTRLHVICLDSRDGKVLWNREFWATGRTVCHEKTCVAAPTPASDGKYIYALPGSSGGVTDAWDGILKHQLDINHKPCNFVELFPRLKEK